MTFKVLRTIKYKPCKSIFALELKNIENLPQYKKYKAYVSNNHCTTSLIINELCSLDQLCEKIQQSSNQALKYFYLAVNKYFIYCTTNQQTKSERPYDDLLVEFCSEQIKDQFKLLDYSVAYNDHGRLGNFIHPVTTMFFQRYD